MARRKWTAAEVVHAIREAYGIAGDMMVADEWGMLTEVPLRDGAGLLHQGFEAGDLVGHLVHDLALLRQQFVGRAHIVEQRRHSLGLGLDAVDHRLLRLERRDALVGRVELGEQHVHGAPQARHLGPAL